MIMKMIRAPCPEIRQLFEAVDMVGKPTLSYIPYIIRRNSTANNPLLLPLFEEICASMKLTQTRNQKLQVDQSVWDSDVDGCPIGESQGIIMSNTSDLDDSSIIRWSDCYNTTEDCKAILPLVLDDQGALRATYEPGLWVSINKVKYDILLPNSPSSKNCQIWPTFPLF